MILIINTTCNNVTSSEISGDLEKQGVEFEIVEAGNMKIGPCVGCNFCWLKTPGICSVRDDHEQILKKMVGADQMWLISDTALGFIDHKGKSVIDRLIPLCTMNLKFKGNQMRHEARYKKQSDIGLIYLGDADREYLERWNQRVTLNFGTKSLGVFPKEEIKEAIACMS